MQETPNTRERTAFSACVILGVWPQTKETKERIIPRWLDAASGETLSVSHIRILRVGKRGRYENEEEKRESHNVKLLIDL